MKIGEFALCTGLSKDTIRYYEKINLLHPALKNNQREYNEHHVEVVHIILQLKQSGFLLHEINKLFELSQNTVHTKPLSDEEIDNVKQLKLLFQHKYEHMVQKEKEIQQIKQVLTKANHKIEQLLEKNNK